MEDGESLAKVLWYYNLLPDLSISQKIICPFHEDANPSMVVDLQKGRCYCFGCQKSYRARSFIKRFEKTDDLQTEIRYQKILHSEKTSKVNVKAAKKKQKKNKELYDEAYDYFHGLSKVDWHKHESEESQEVLYYMVKRGFKIDTLQKLNAKVTYSYNYPLVFPIMDNGKFRGWVCRTDKPEIEKKRKYLYNTGFSRYTTLVGDYGSKDYIYVVEGYMDRAKFIQFGENNVVALFGWKATDSQIEKLKSAGIKYIISALDNDKYGKQGTEYLKKYFKVIRFSYLKGIKDPGDMDIGQFEKMNKRTMKKFKEAIKNEFAQ